MFRRMVFLVVACTFAFAVYLTSDVNSQVVRENATVTFYADPPGPIM